MFFYIATYFNFLYMQNCIYIYSFTIQLFFHPRLQIVGHFLDLYRLSQKYSQSWIVRELLWIRIMGKQMLAICDRNQYCVKYLCLFHLFVVMKRKLLHQQIVLAHIMITIITDHHLAVHDMVIVIIHPALGMYYNVYYYKDKNRIKHFLFIV